MKADCTPQYLDEVIDVMDASYAKVKAYQTSIVRLVPAEIELLQAFGDFRDIVLRTLQSGVVGRCKLKHVFGDDNCRRIAHVKVILENLQVSSAHTNDQRLATCAGACDSLTEVLRDLGMEETLAQAMKIAKAHLSQRVLTLRAAAIAIARICGKSALRSVERATKRETGARSTMEPIPEDAEKNTEQGNGKLLEEHDLPSQVQLMRLSEFLMDSGITFPDRSVKGKLSGWLGVGSTCFSTHCSARWCELKGATLQWYPDDEDPLLIGVVWLTDSVRFVPHNKGGKYGFLLEPGYHDGIANRLYYFVTGSAAVQRIWINALTQVTKASCVENFCGICKTVAPEIDVGSSSLCQLPFIAGWLSKRGPSASYRWLARWCVLEGDSLRYFSDDVRREPKGQINLMPGSQAVSFVSENNLMGDSSKYRSSKPGGFVLDSNPAGGPHRRMYYFNAGDAKFLSAWLHAINSRLPVQR